MRRMLPALLALAIVAVVASPADACLFGRRTVHNRSCAVLGVQTTTYAVPQAQAPCAANVYAAPQAIPTSQTTTTTQTTYQTIEQTDVFVVKLNQHRARWGLRAVARDAELCASARSNNLMQAVRGLGHWVMGGGMQCAAMAPTPDAALGMWLSSPSHAAILLSPSIQFIGFDAVSSWSTANCR
jgi:uncharacterized protein YkwD